MTRRCILAPGSPLANSLQYQRVSNRHRLPQKAPPLPTSGAARWQVACGEPRRCFDPEVENSEAAVRLCPSADDLWFFWMARRKGSLYRKVGDVFPHTFWPGSQEEALTYVNHLGGENNKQIKALQSAFPLAGIRLD